MIPFLLKLTPDQEKYVGWALNAAGPTLLKGGPGTGKSTIALYRVRALLQELRRQGQAEARILFTTYTNALVNSSRQQLEQLLGKDIGQVQVTIVDKLVVKLLAQAGPLPHILGDDEALTLLKQALAETRFDGSPAQQEQQRQGLARISLEYLMQEINQVIVARQLATFKDYLDTSRPGRKLRLNALQRRAVWAVHQTFQRLLNQQHKVTWRQARALAEEYVTQGKVQETYDAVIIDEAQDLDPSALRLLVSLCKQANRVFVTADANQSIYGSGFNWADVHGDLRFQGRTAILHANYRSTREIGEAAQSYLAGGVLDAEPVERHYIHSGPKPAQRRVPNSGEQIQLLVTFLKAARSLFRVNLGSCAVLCPSSKAGRAVAADLSSRGLQATFMSSADLDLKYPGVKVLPLQAAKGLEFPIVVLAGFLESSWHTTTPNMPNADEREELLVLERRTMFVAMTRAMRGLLVVIPDWAKSSLMSGFNEQDWNLGE